MNLTRNDPPPVDDIEHYTLLAGVVEIRAQKRLNSKNEDFRWTVYPSTQAYGETCEAAALSLAGHLERAAAELRRLATEETT